MRLKPLIEVANNLLVGAGGLSIIGYPFEGKAVWPVDIRGVERGGYPRLSSTLFYELIIVDNEKSQVCS